MLWIYAGLDILEAKKQALSELPTEHIDISKVSVEDLTKTMYDIYNHHVSGHIFIGYLDPLLMLHPTDETKLRKGFEKFDISIIVSNPIILPLSWKNGTSRMRIIETSHHVDRTKVIDDGCSSHVQDETRHGPAPTQTPDQRNIDKSGETRSAPKRRKQKRQNKEEES